MPTPVPQPSSQPRPTANAAGAPVLPPLAAAANPTPVQPQRDRLVVSANKGPAAAPAPEAPAAKPVQARPLAPVRHPAVDAKARAESKTNVGFKFRLTGLISFFTTALTSWVFDPRLLVNHVKTVFGQVYRLASGTKRVHAVATGLAAARKEGKASEYVRGVAGQVEHWAARGVQGAKSKIVGIFTKDKAAAGTVTKAVATEATAPTAAAVRNLGLVGWFRAERAAGASPLSALAKGFNRTLETGGDMPRIVEHAKTMGGMWGKAFEATGKVARLAPLLNVPIAILDIIHARQISQDPSARGRVRFAKMGQAYFSSVAAALSIAAFLVPAPLDAIALKAAGTAGLGSLGWSVLTSRFMVNLFIKIGNFLHIGPKRELEPAGPQE